MDILLTEAGSWLKDGNLLNEVMVLCTFMLNSNKILKYNAGDQISLKEGYFMKLYKAFLKKLKANRYKQIRLVCVDAAPCHLEFLTDITAQQIHATQD
jgi:hypothetical protein